MKRTVHCEIPDCPETRTVLAGGGNTPDPRVLVELGWSYLPLKGWVCDIHSDIQKRRA